MGDHYQFDVVPQWVNGELQLKLSRRLTSETTMLNYFYPDTVTLTKASSSIWDQSDATSSLPDGTMR